MSAIRLSATAGADGVLMLAIPVGVAGGRYEVVVTPTPAANGTGKTPEELGWPPGYFEQTAGSITDPAFKRYPQGEFEERTPLE